MDFVPLYSLLVLDLVFIASVLLYTPQNMVVFNLQIVGILAWATCLAQLLFPELSISPTFRLYRFLDLFFLFSSIYL